MVGAQSTLPCCDESTPRIYSTVVCSLLLCLGSVALTRCKLSLGRRRLFSFYISRAGCVTVGRSKRLSKDTWKDPICFYDL